MTQVAELPAVAKKTPDPTPPDDLPSENVRIAGDLMEMLRLLAFHSRDHRGKRRKIAHLVDDYLRSLVTRDHRALEKRLAQEKADE